MLSAKAAPASSSVGCWVTSICESICFSASFCGGERRLAPTPDAIAVVSGETAVSYLDLARRVSARARVGGIAIGSDLSIEMAIGMLAACKAGEARSRGWAKGTSTTLRIRPGWASMMTTR